MCKEEFLLRMRAAFAYLPPESKEERIAFYSEMIDDRMEDGLSEEEAVAAVSTTIEILWAAPEKAPPRKEKEKRSTLVILLLILGAPVWFSLLIALVSVLFSLYAVLWSLIGSLWAVFGALAACSVSGILAGTLFAGTGNALSGVAMIGAGLVCAGLSIFLYFGCMAATKGACILTKNLIPWIRQAFTKRR